MQTITADERTWLETATVREKVVRLELLDSSEQVLEILDLEADPDAGQIVDGNITVDTTRDVLRAFSLTLADPMGYWSIGPGARLWLDKRVRLSVGYVINGAARYWPQGVYLLAVPEVDGTNGRRVLLSGVDKSALANGRPRGGFTQAITIVKGRLVHEAIGDMMDLPQWAETKRNLTSSTVSLPWQESYGPPQGSPWEAALAFAKVPEILSDGAAVSRLFYDVNGYGTLTPDPDPLLLAPVWTFRPNSTGVSLLIGSRKVIDDGELRNAVLVRGGRPKGSQVEYLATDTSANLGVDAIGYRLHYYNGAQPDPLISTAAEAEARAKYELRQYLAWQERIPLSIVELPVLEPWDVIRNEDPQASVNDNYQLISYTLPLTASGRMQAEGWRVRRVAS